MFVGYLAVEATVTRLFSSPKYIAYTLDHFPSIFGSCSVMRFTLKTHFLSTFLLFGALVKRQSVEISFVSLFLPSIFSR